MTINSKGYVLVTGASSGIGKACAINLAQQGYKIFAGILDQTEAKELSGPYLHNITPLIIDITDQKEIEAAYQLIAKKTGDDGLYGLVNNAGIGFGGPIECIPIEQLKAMFETDVFGHIAVIQKFLPLIRKGHGRIVNISSICSGQLSQPFLSTYSAAKTALESFSDTLRLELGPWNIPVTIIKPGNIDTAIWQKIKETTRKMFTQYSMNEQELYKTSITAFLDTSEKFRKMILPPEAVAKTLEHVLTVKKPRTRYLVGEDAFLLYHLIKPLPDLIRDIILSHLIGLPKKGSMAFK